MNKHKLDYEAPEASTFVVRFEGCLCTSPIEGEAGEKQNYNNYDEDF